MHQEKGGLLFFAQTLKGERLPTKVEWRTLEFIVSKEMVSGVSGSFALTICILSPASHSSSSLSKHDSTRIHHIFAFCRTLFIVRSVRQGVYER